MKINDSDDKEACNFKSGGSVGRRQNKAKL